MNVVESLGMLKKFNQWYTDQEGDTFDTDSMREERMGRKAKEVMKHFSNENALKVMDVEEAWMRSPPFEYNGMGNVLFKPVFERSKLKISERLLESIASPDSRWQTGVDAILLKGDDLVRCSARWDADAIRAAASGIQKKDPTYEKFKKNRMNPNNQSREAFAASQLGKRAITKDLDKLQCVPFNMQAKDDLTLLELADASLDYIFDTALEEKLWIESKFVSRSVADAEHRMAARRCSLGM